MANDELTTTDQRHITEEEVAKARLQEQSANANPPPAELSEALAQIKTSDVAVDRGETEQSIPEKIGDFDLEAQLRGLEQAEQFDAFQGQTKERKAGADNALDPVMMFNGQYVYTAQDIKINGAGMDFAFTRTYKNQTYYEGPLGVNWDHNYNLYLRVEFGGAVLVRSSGEFREDRYVLHEQHNYYVPPDGYHDIIIGRDHFNDHEELLKCCSDDLVPGHSYSYVLRTPGGMGFLYEQIPGIVVHRIKKIRDRFGNYLWFEYNTEHRLEVVRVNHPDRWVHFGYDDLNRITDITIYGVSYPWHNGPHERAWRYEYDDLGDLITVTTPPTCAYPRHDPEPKVRGFPSGLTTRYEYSTPYQVGELRHNLLHITDPAGQLYLENEYGDAPGLLSFNRVVRQRQGNGVSHLEYYDIIPEGDWDYAPEEQPAYKTILYERDGHAIEHYYNGSGKLIVKSEAVRDGRGHRTLTWRFRYNKDGALIASLSPEGMIVQQYYGREDFYARRLDPDDPGIEPAQDPNLTAQGRIKFGNLLASVRRGTKWDFRQLVSQIPDQDSFKDFFPNILTRTDPTDIIRKFTYSPDYQQVLTISDPRHTASADPRAPESQTYQDQLTRYVYSQAPQSLLLKIRRPGTTLPDGTVDWQEITEDFLEYDPRGRLLKSRDAEGGLTIRHYYPPEAGLREGYLQREIRQQSSWLLSSSALPLAHIRWSDGWITQDSHRLTDGSGGQSFEMDFAGSGLVLYQDEDGETRRGEDAAVSIELVDRDGNVLPQPAWDQTQQPTYPIWDLPSDTYTLRLRATVGSSISLGRVDVFQQVEYEVNEAGLVTAVTNPRGLRSETVVNELDQVIAGIASPPFSYETYTSSNENRRVEKSYHELVPAIDGNRYQLTSYEYDEQDNLTEEAIGGDQAEPLVTRHYYNSSDKRVKTILPRGNAILYRYEERKLLSKVIRAACTPDESIVRTMYDGDGRRIETVDPLGHRTHFDYDPLGRLVLVEDARGNMQRTTYDKLDNVVAEYFFEKRDEKFYLLTKRSYDYDELGRRRRLVDYLFDSPIEVAAFDPRSLNQDPDSEQDFLAFSDAVNQGMVTKVNADFYLDKKGRVFRTVRYGILPPNAATNQSNRTKDKEQITEQGYDALDRLIWTRDALGNYTVTTYDPRGNVIRTDTHEVVTDSNSGAFLYEEIFSSINEYDELDRPTANIDSLGNRTEMYFDSRGNVIRQKDALGNIGRREYDIYNREICSLKEMTPPGLGGVAPTDAIVTKSVYDANGNVTHLIDPRGAVTHHEYDMLDRRTRTQYNYPHDPSYQSWQYDPASNFLVYRDNNGLKRRYRYDKLNRLRTMTLDETGVVASQYLADDTDDVETYTYDGLGRVLQQSNKYADIEASYDSFGRPQVEKLWYKPSPAGAAQPLVVHRVYDVFSNLEKLTYPGNREVQYRYDSLNRIIHIENVAKGNDYPGRPATPDDYDILRHEYGGRRLYDTQYGNGSGSRFSYDGARRLIDIHHYGPKDSLLLKIQQLYDAFGNKRFEINIRPDITHPGQTRTDTEIYKYDSLYRLTHYGPAAMQPIDPVDFQASRQLLSPEQLTGQQTIDATVGNLAQNINYTYRYDASGNRLESREPHGPQIDYVPNLLNQYQLLTDIGSNASVQPTYDLAGNMINYEARRYYYNHRHQVARVEHGQQQIAQFRYDVLGRLLVAIYPAANEQVYYVYDGSNVIAEYRATAGAWTCIAQYVNGIGLDNRYQIATEQMAYWYHYNNVRSTRLLTDVNGGVVEYEYGPFGNLRRSSPAPLPYNPYLFSARRYDQFIDAYDFRTRIYRTTWGRFLQRDPKENGDTLNLYQALGNNPLIYVDPLGTEKQAVESETSFETRLGRFIEKTKREILERERSKREIFDSELRRAREAIRSAESLNELRKISLPVLPRTATPEQISLALKVHGELVDRKAGGFPEGSLFFQGRILGRYSLEKFGELSETLFRLSGALRFTTTGHIITETRSGVEQEFKLGTFRSKTIFEGTPAVLMDRMASATQALAVGPFEVRKNFLEPGIEFRYRTLKMELSKLMLETTVRSAVSPTSGETGVIVKVGPIEAQLNYGFKGLSVETARAGPAEVLLNTPDIGAFLWSAVLYGRPPD